MVLDQKLQILAVLQKPSVPRKHSSSLRCFPHHEMRMGVTKHMMEGSS